MNPLVALPDATSMLNQVASSSSPLFSSVFPIAIIGIGFAVGAIIILFLMDAITGAFSRFIHRRHDRYADSPHGD